MYSTGFVLIYVITMAVYLASSSTDHVPYWRSHCKSDEITIVTECQSFCIYKILIKKRIEEYQSHFYLYLPPENERIIGWKSPRGFRPQYQESSTHRCMFSKAERTNLTIRWILKTLHLEANKASIDKYKLLSRKPVGLMMDCYFQGV
jgi:hypothetical protein